MPTSPSCRCCQQGVSLGVVDIPSCSPNCPNPEATVNPLTSREGCLVPGTPPAFRWICRMERGRNDQKDPCLINPLCWYASHAPQQQSSNPSPLPIMHVCCPRRSMPVCVFVTLMCCHIMCVQRVSPCNAA